MFHWKDSCLAKQVWLVSSVLLFNISCGMMVDESLTGQMDSGFPTRIETKYIFIFGLISSAILMQSCGRRKAFITATLSALVAWLNIYFADTNSSYTIGRGFGEFAKGSGIILGAIIIGENTSSSSRGVFLALTFGFLSFGRLASFLLGDWNTIAIFALVACLLSFAISCTWSESPEWLVFKKSFDDSKKSLFFLSETDRIEHPKLTHNEERSKSTLWTFKILTDVFKTNNNIIKPMVNILFANILLEASGKHVFDSCGPLILDEILRTPSLFNHSLIISIIATTSNISSSFLFKECRRRTVIFLTGSASILVLSIASFTLFLISNNVSIAPSIPLSLLAIYIAMTNLSATVIFFVWCGELLPFKNKSVGLLLSGILLTINKSICLNIAPNILAGLKLYGAFGFSSVVSTTTLLILYFIAPETSDKNLLDIEHCLS